MSRSPSHKTHQLAPWARLSSFPENPGGWASIRKNQLRHLTEAEAAREAASWNLFSPTLLGSPSTDRLLPAILVPEFANALRQKVIRHTRNNALVASVGCIAFFYLFSGLFLEVASYWPSVLLMLLISLLFWSEHLNAKNDQAFLAERALYLAWVRSRLTCGYWIIPGTLLVAGIAQTASGHWFTGRNWILEDYGLIYEQVNNGEYWRLLTGPFFHSSPTHWLINSSLLLMFSVFVFALPRSELHICLFLIATTLSGLAAYITHEYLPFSLPASYDGFAGISGGVFYLQGFMLANACRNSSSYPRGLLLIFAVMTTVNLVLPLMTENNISIAAHAAGLACGLLIGAFFAPAGESNNLGREDSHV